MHARLLASLFATLTAAAPFVRPPAPAPNAEHSLRGERPTQFVLLSYDATPGPDPRHDHYTQIADAIREITHGRGHITLFLNAQFFMLPHAWQPPRGSRWEGHPELYARYLDPQPRNQLVIPYASDPDQIEGRIRTVQALARGGTELAGHGVRHYDGREWTDAQWRADFDEYDRYMHDVVGIDPPRGFRAPFLAWSRTLFRVEGERRLAYDASRASNSMAIWPRRMRNGVWQIAVPTYFFPRLGRTILGFDDSYHLRHITESELGEVYYTEFMRRYRGSRAPMIIASHGTYTPPTLRLAAHVCRMPDVRCATYSEFVQYMNEHPELEGRHDYTRLRAAR